MLLGLLTVLTIVDWPIEWRYGIQYLGMRHTVLLCILDGMWLASGSLVNSAVLPAAAITQSQAISTLGLICVAGLVCVSVLW